MSNPIEFSFGDNSVAKAYDSVLVPVLFEPWAFQLIKEYQPWTNTNVLDLACGTGVVTKELARNVLPNGKVFALDINKEMLDLAKLKCATWKKDMEFIEGSCEAIPIADNTLDTVVCQQGFQFFPNKKLAAAEIHRVLKPSGKAIISTWCPVAECEMMGLIYDTLEQLNEKELAQMIRIPFDFMAKEKLETLFKVTGFSTTTVTKHELPLKILGGLDAIIPFVYATPIGPKLKDLSNETKADFKAVLMEKMNTLSPDGKTFGRMVSHILKTEK